MRAEKVCRHKRNKRHVTYIRILIGHFKRPTPMKRQITLLSFILIICLTSCGQTNPETKNQEQSHNIFTVDTSVVAILPFDTTQDWIFKDSKPTDLTNGDLLKIDTMLNICINDYKLDKKNFTIDLTRYKRQYVAVLNSKGEKEVWVNCFCRAENQDWKKNLIFVEDGGNCYFNLKINLTTGQYYELMVNGDA